MFTTAKLRQNGERAKSQPVIGLAVCFAAVTIRNTTLTICCIPAASGTFPAICLEFWREKRKFAISILVYMLERIQKSRAIAEHCCHTSDNPIEKEKLLDSLFGTTPGFSQADESGRILPRCKDTILISILQEMSELFWFSTSFFNIWHLLRSYIPYMISAAHHDW